MEEELELALMEVQEGMEKAIEHLNDELLKIRAGKASPEMLGSIFVDAYGVKSPLNSVATVNTPDARSLLIQPFDKGVIGEIERAIINSNLGFNPQNDGSLIRINLPPLTEERRRELVKLAKGEMENAKVSIRNVRKNGMESIKKMVKDGLAEDLGKDAEDQIQQFTDSFSQKAEDLYAKKEKDIMTV